jgi:hypothetical protein
MKLAEGLDLPGKVSSNGRIVPDENASGDGEPS